MFDIVSFLDKTMKWNIFVEVAKNCNAIAKIVNKNTYFLTSLYLCKYKKKKKKKNALIQLFGTERLESKVFIVKDFIKV